MRLFSVPSTATTATTKCEARVRAVRIRGGISAPGWDDGDEYRTAVKIGGRPAGQECGVAAVTVTPTVTGNTRQEGAAVDISPVVPPARRWFGFQKYASSWQGTPAVGLDLIAGQGVCPAPGPLGASTNWRALPSAGAP